MVEETSQAFNWEMVTAIATCVSAGVLLLAALFAWRQVRTARLNTNAALLVGLYEHLRSQETIGVLRLIYRTKPEEMKNLAPTDIYNIERLLDRLDMIGHLVKRGIIDKYLAIETFAGPAVIRCWYQLNPMVKDNRKKRGGRYGKGFEYFAKHVVKYYIEHHNKTLWTLLYYPEDTMEGNSVNLIQQEIDNPRLLSRSELRLVLLRSRFTKKVLY